MYDDFTELKIDLKNKILIPLLDKKILLSDVNEFFKEWDFIFNKKYPIQYPVTTKYFNTYVDEFDFNRQRKRELRIRLALEGIIPTITAIILFLISPNFVK